MIAIVHDAYAELPLDVCKNVWTTAQLVMNQVLLCNGGNDYKLPHIDATTTLVSFQQWVCLYACCFSSASLFGFGT